MDPFAILHTVLFLQDHRILRVHPSKTSSLCHTHKQSSILNPENRALDFSTQKLDAIQKIQAPAMTNTSQKGNAVNMSK